MASNPAAELASTLQSVSLKRDPSPNHDINPSTSTSSKTEARVHSDVVLGPSTQSPPATSSTSSSDPIHLTTTTSSSSSSLSISIPSTTASPRSRPRTRTRPHHPPLPDLRFEQSYLSSIRDAGSWWRIGYITMRDQVLMPLMQGVCWNLAVFGWRYWNRGAMVGGASLGARVRRWWWRVNDWELPSDGGGNSGGKATGGGVMKGVREVEIEDFYVVEFGSALGD